MKAARETDVAMRKAKRLDASESEASLVADETTPYRLLSEVLFTLGQHSIGKFHLVVVKG